MQQYRQGGQKARYIKPVPLQTCTTAVKWNRIHVGTQHAQTVCMWVFRQCYNVLPQCVTVHTRCMLCLCVCVCLYASVVFKNGKRTHCILVH